MADVRANPRARVAILDWPSIGDVDVVLGRILDLMGGLDRFVRPGQYVLVKPNLVAGAPASSGGTTHVELIEALVRRIQALRPSRLIVADGSAVADAPGTWELLGYRAMAERTSVEMVDLDHVEHVPAPLADPVYPGTLAVARPILECDVYISVGCLKTHLNAGITVAMKNAFGALSQEARTRIHREYRLEESLCDLNRIRRPDLVVVDGLVGAEGVAGGSDFTAPFGAKLMLAGDNPVAVDAIGARVMQQNPRIRYVDWAAERGVGLNDPERIEVVGLTVERVARNYMSPGEHLLRTMRNLQVNDLGACTGCTTLFNGALARYRGMELARPLSAVLGGEDRDDLLPSPPEGGELLVVGDCAKDLRHAGTFIPGCPPNPADLHAFLSDHGFACRRCHAVLEPVLSEIEAESLHDDLRAACGGDVLHRGVNNQMRPTDLTLLVGDCMTHYNRNSRLRANQVLGGQGDNVVFVPGCPPDIANVRDGVERLRAYAGKRRS